MTFSSLEVKAAYERERRQRMKNLSGVCIERDTWKRVEAFATKHSLSKAGAVRTLLEWSLEEASQ